MARAGGKLFDRFVSAAGLAQHPAFERGKLIGTDDDVIRMGGGDCHRLLGSQPPYQLGGLLRWLRRLVDVRSNDRERHADSL